MSETDSRAVVPKNSLLKYLDQRLCARGLACAIIIGSCAVITEPVQAQIQIKSMVSEVFEGSPFLVQAGIMPALDKGKINNIHFADSDGLRRFYEGREFEPIWVNIGRGQTRKVSSALEAFEKSWTHGLNPENYHVYEISQLLERDDDEALFMLELLTSDASVRYVRDLSSMRVASNMVSRTIRNMQTRPITEDVLAYIEDNSNAGRALSAFEPKGNLYSLLQTELVELVESEAEPYEPLLPIRAQGVIRPGDSHRAISAIRQRLNADVQSATANYYDNDLVQTVMHFQQQNGLADDGVIGPRTLEVMNITREQKIERVIANLERLRWVAREKPDRYILVNIPSATLWAIEDGRVVLDMPVILGKKKRATESFVTEIKGIRFNPNWTIPPTIKKEDFLPNLVEDPYYATNRGIEFVHGYGENAMTIDPGMIDWATIEWEDFKQIRMIQNPGRSNPLGQMRVLMPNPYNIYLHDTNKPEYFQKDNRFISSGCVRVAKPMQLTHFIMEGRQDWSDEQLKNILDSQKLTEVSVGEELPVFILYQTVWLGDDRKIVYGPDVYGKDRSLVRHMKEKNLFYVPAHNEKKDKIVENSSSQGVARISVNP
ncbi:MAG: L,D-transpeptidase family protein [Pseudomonadota bacterium]